MKSRIPLAYAGLLIVALVAVVGFAAFSPSSSNTTATTEAVETTPTDSATASARVASAVLALRVSDAESRTATTTGGSTTTLVTTTTEDPEEASDDVEPIDAAAIEVEPSTTTESPTTTESAPTTNAPSTTDAPSTADTTPPALKVTSPADGSTVDERVVTFSGTTERGATVSSGPYDATVDDDGEWSIQLVLAPGANGAAFTARDDAGNTTNVRVVITYDEPQAATTTTTQAPSTTTTTAGSSDPAPKWSPLWPADAGGIRNVEAWRSLVAKHWPANLVDCALNIIDLESKGDPTAYNSRSSAEGLFQHLSKYWKGRAAAAGFKDSNGLYASPYNAEANIAAAWVIAKASSPWHRPWTVNPFYGACQP